MSTGAEQWVEHEFATAALGDARLERRFRSLLVDLSRHCSKTLASSFEPWSKIKGAYRFFANARVQLHAMLAPHLEQTARRIREHRGATVLLVQDTTYLDFAARPKTRGLDQVGSHASGTIIEGLMLHTTLACDGEGLPLGLLDQRFIDRKRLGEARGAEGTRWADVVTAVHERDFGDTRTVHVMDREGDDYELFARAAALGEHVLVRAQHNRAINKSTPREASSEWLFETLSNKRAQGRTRVRVQSNGRKKFRTATLSIVHMEFEMPPSREALAAAQGAVPPTLALRAIMAIERNGAPNLQEALCWVLITDLEVSDTDSAIEKVQWYSKRWSIELFHKILKSGCAVEKAQLRHAERLKKYIVLKSLVAWRLFWLTRLREHDPNGSCEAVLEPLEWQLLYRKTHKTSRAPETPPSLSEALIWIAKLGGYIARPSDPPPGIISQWRGWERLAELVDDYRDICGSS